MRRIIVVCCAFFSPLLALPLGNPADPMLYTTGLIPNDPCNLFCWKEVGMIRFGFYGDYVFNAYMEVDSNTSSGKIIRDTRVITNAALLVFNAFQYVDVFGTLGVSTMELLLNGSAFSPDPQLFGVSLDNAISWSVGGRGILYRYGALTLGAEAQYQFFAPKISHLSRRGGGVLYYPNQDTTFQSQWWQAGIALAATAGGPDFQLVPYCGFKLSGAQFSIENYTEIFPNVGTTYVFTALVAKKLYGFGVGMTALVRQKMSLNIEGQFGDEKAMSLNAQANF